MKENKDVMIGVDAGLKLTTQLGKGFAVFLTPSIYLLNTKSSLIGANTVGFGKFRFYETVNLGVQYKVGKLRPDPVKAKARRLRRQENWRNKQIEKTHKWQDKQQYKFEKRRLKHELRRSK